MYRIIPFIIFFAAMFYLFYGPAPMNKIEEIVKKRDCYQLRLMDQERLRLSSDKINSPVNSTASIKNEHPSGKNLLKKKEKRANISLALSLKTTN